MPTSNLPEPSTSITAYFKMIDDNPDWVATIKTKLKNDFVQNGITPVSAKRYQGKREDNGEPFVDINDHWVHPQASRIKIMPKVFKQEMGLPEPELGSLMRIGTYHALLRTVAQLPPHLIDASIKGGTINFTGEIWHQSLDDAVWATFTQQSACYKGIEGSDIKNRILRPGVAAPVNFSYGHTAKAETAIVKSQSKM